MPDLTENRTRTNIEIAKTLGFEPMVMNQNGEPYTRTWRWPDEWRGRYGSSPHTALPDFVRLIEEGIRIRDGFRVGFGEDPDFYQKSIVPKDRTTGGGLPHTVFGNSPEEIIVEVFGEEHAVNVNGSA